MKAVALVASEGSARASEARRALRLDPRTKVLMLVCANVTLLCSGFDAAGFVLKFLVAGIVVALLIAAGRRAAGIGFAAVFAAAALLEQMNERGLLDALGSTSAAAVTLRFLSALVLQLMPGTMFAYYLFATTKVSEFVAAMERVRLPQRVIIPFAVVFRFFPTVLEEYRSIRDAMRLRGVGWRSGPVARKANEIARDERTEHAGGFRVPRPRLRNYLESSVVPISAVCALLFFCYSSLLAFLTPFAAESGLETPASFFFVVYAIATFVTRPFTGKLFDRKGDRVVMVPAFIAFIVGMGLLATVYQPTAMLIAAALLGFGVGTVQASGLALAVRLAPDDRLSLANSTFYILLDIGVGVGPLLLGIVQPLWGYRGLFEAMSLVAIVALAAYLLVSRKKGTMRRKLEEAEKR